MRAYGKGRGQKKGRRGPYISVPDEGGDFLGRLPDQREIGAGGRVGLGPPLLPIAQRAERNAIAPRKPMLREPRAMADAADEAAERIARRIVCGIIGRLNRCESGERVHAPNLRDRAALRTCHM